MESTQSQGDSSPQEDNEVLAAALVLSSFNYTKHHGSDGITYAQSRAIAASRSSVPTHEPRDSNRPIVRLVNDLIDSIGECQGPFTKTISKSNVHKQQSRLLIPELDFHKFIKSLLTGNEDLEMGVLVQTFDTAGKAYPMQLKKWSSSKAHVLMDDWNKFVEENPLEDWSGLTIRSFRAVQTGGLCFLISSGTVHASE